MKTTTKMPSKKSKDCIYNNIWHLFHSICLILILLDIEQSAYRSYVHRRQRKIHAVLYVCISVSLPLCICVRKMPIQA